MEVLMVFAFVGIIIVALMAIGRQSFKDEAKNTYEFALSKFRKDPTNVELRQDVLNAGRRYSSLTRNSNGTSSFDEMAIKNDLDTAMASANPGVLEQSSDHATQAETQDRSIAERLGILDDLMQQGLITEEEYSERRREILQEI